jgi:hypothetical protein
MGNLYDSSCLITYYPFYSHALIFSLAYLTQDLIKNVFIIQDFSKLGI